MNKIYTRVWAMPLLLAVLIMFGLLAALLGTGIWHALSWAALLVPVITFGWFVLKPKSK